ncbi:caspase-8 [Boleophthalmus pectinirostris]|uniref:caspase-8 n=1 Tax=Boleophthalmus pectinirostris TaxID=150288 RepID=UPI000A1C64A6|nr:caspase-8 [Boleophthalmus pectinirostris]
MDFQRLLLQIGQSLGSEEVKALAFLCTDVSKRSLNSLELFSDLCSILSDQDLLSPEKPDLLQELLLTIQRPRLVRHLQQTHPGPRTELIPAYRKLLYNLSEDITDEDLRSIKFLLNPKLPRKKLDENVTTLELFLEMEHMDLLSEFNLDLLQEIFQSVCPVLNEKINRFKEQAVHVQSGFEGMNSSTSLPFPADQNQCPLYDQLLYEGSNGMSFQSTPQVSVDRPNASVDFPYGSASCQDSSVSPEQVSGPNMVPNCSSVKEGANISNKTDSELNISSEARNYEEVGTYPMNGVKRGICLIINNYDFINKKKREGTQFDKECLNQVFSWLGFEVEVHNDCTGEKMLSVMQNLSRRDHRDMDSVVCCILSHGQEGGVFGVDDQTVPINEMTALFNGSSCPSLIDKPKIFFIQACQGKQEQQAVKIESDGPVSCIENDAVKVEDSIPSDADFLLGMATVPSYVSYRDRNSGSWFIQTLCENLIHMVPRQLDLVSILTKVNADVSKKTGPKEPKKQMPQPAFSLRKKVIFPVPSAHPPRLWQ